MLQRMLLLTKRGNMVTNFLIKTFVKNPNDTKSVTVRGAYGKLASIVGISCNLAIALGKIILGILIGSMAITADGVNNFSDASAGVISLFGFRMASKPADAEHPYGHGRYEYISALTVAVLVMVIGIELLGSSFDKILHPTDVDFGIVTTILLVASILIKLWMLFFYRKIGKKIDSGVLLASSADSRNDVIATSAVLAGSLLSHFTSWQVDGYMGVGVAIFIMYSSLGLIRDTLNPMLGMAPKPEFVEEIRQKIISYPEVLGIHDLLLHDYGPGRQFGSVHVEMAAEGDVMFHHDVIDNIERDCQRELGLHIIIHYDPIVTSDVKTNQLRAWLKSEVKSKLGTDISVHDLRTVPGQTHTNVIFDVAAPYEYAMTDAQLKAAIQDLMKDKYPDHYLVITVERMHSYMPH